MEPDQPRAAAVPLPPPSLRSRYSIALAVIASLLVAAALEACVLFVNDRPPAILVFDAAEEQLLPSSALSPLSSRSEGSAAHTGPGTRDDPPSIEVILGPSLPAYSPRRLKPAPCVALLLMIPDDRMMLYWAEVLGLAQTNEDIEVFMLMFRGPPSPETLAAANEISRGALRVAWHTPGTTWTTGRNLLAQVAYAAEVARGSRYRYWAFSDHETLSCKGCSTAHPSVEQGNGRFGLNYSGLACCFDFIVANGLLAPMRYAVYAVNVNYNPEDMHDALLRKFRECVLDNCQDGKFIGMHRDAAPVLLPYAEHFDNESWYASQLISNFISSGCIFGGVVDFQRDVRTVDESHGSYPRSIISNALLSDFIHHEYPALVVSGAPLNATSSKTAYCRGGARIVTFPAWDASKMVSEEALEAQRAKWVRDGVIPPEHDWRDCAPYKACLAVLQPRFDAEVGRGIPPPAPVAWSKIS